MSGSEFLEVVNGFISHCLLSVFITLLMNSKTVRIVECSHKSPSTKVVKASYPVCACARGKVIGHVRLLPSPVIVVIVC